MVGDKLYKIKIKNYFIKNSHFKIPSETHYGIVINKYYLYNINIKYYYFYGIYIDIVGDTL